MTYTASAAQAGRGSIIAIGEALSPTGTTTSGSDSITSVSSTAGITVGMPIAGNGIPAGAIVTAIGSGTLTISANATAGASGVALTVGPQPVGEVKNVPFERGKWQFVDVTNFESGADKEIIPTIRDNGGIAVEGNRVSGNAGQVLVEAAYQAGALNSFTLLLPKAAAQTHSGDKYVFSAYVESSDFTVDVEKEIDFKMSLKISGAVTLTVGT